MQNEGSAVHGLNIKFGPNSGGADLNFATRLFGSDTGEEYETAYWNFNELVSSITYDPSEWVYLPFQTPIELNPGTAYFAAVMNDSYSESQLTVMGNSTGDTDNSTMEYLIDGAGDFIWFWNQGGVVPAIRLVLSPQDFAGCTDAIACNFNSVATIDDGSCIYETCGCMDEEACNYDAGAEFDDGSCCVCIEAGITMDVGLDYLVGTWQLSSAAVHFLLALSHCLVNGLVQLKMDLKPHNTMIPGHFIPAVSLFIRTAGLRWCLGLITLNKLLLLSLLFLRSLIMDHFLVAQHSQFRECYRMNWGWFVVGLVQWTLARNMKCYRSLKQASQS
jgi:hypothetical protein